MKIKKFFTSLFISIIGIVLFATGISLAWLANARTNLNIGNLEGGVISQYFHCGEGTSEKPFVITRPVHLYNMTELYENLDGFASENHYFQLGYDLDNDPNTLEFYTYDDDGHLQDGYTNYLNMNYYEHLMPIGSEDKPFGGTFDGSGLVIENLNISGEGKSDIGVFGYVTDNANIKDLYVDNLTISVSNAVDNKHQLHSTNAYVGYIAGHIDDATCFENVYVNNCQITGASCDIKNDWGYFGYCDNAATLQDFVNKASGQGSVNAWGGSFNSKDYTALGYTLGPKSSGTYTKEITGMGGYKMVITASTNANPANNQVIYRLRDGSYVPLKINSEDRAHNKNTGYLVGSNVGTGVNASPKISSYKLVNIGNALSNTAYTNMADTYKSSTPNISYDDSKLEVLTYYNNGWRRISDAHNQNNTTTNTQIRNYTKTSFSDLGLIKYEDSRNSLQDILTGSSFIHGIHFDNNQVSASNLLTVPANTARIDGTEYTTTYQVPKGSINFKLREKGIINFFAGTYNSSQVNLNFFSLHQVNRNGGNISSIKEITQIYENTGDGNPYVYKYSDNSYSAGTRGNLVFDIATILKGNSPVVNMLYYFEVPVNAGEYAMGVAGSTQGAYMIYLDLGANAGQTQAVVDEFNLIDYRSRPDISERSILLITYEQFTNQNINLEVVYIENQNRYNITYSGDLNSITITVLSNDYNVYFNGQLWSYGINSHPFS